MRQAAAVQGQDGKSACAARYQNAGLVVDPNLCPDSFASEEKLADAKELWERFTKDHRIRPWNLDVQGKSLSENFQPHCTVNTDKSDRDHYGCLLFRGHYLYGDYDLYDIVIPEQVTRNLALVHGDQAEGRYFWTVQKYVNGRIGVSMIQHGGQAQGYGHKDDDTVLVFGPNGARFVEEGNIEALYARLFPGRRVIDIF